MLSTQGTTLEENRKRFVRQMLVGAHQSLVWCGGTETCLGSWLQHPSTAQQAASWLWPEALALPHSAEHLAAPCWGERCLPPCWYQQERQSWDRGTAGSLPVALVYHLVELIHPPGGFVTQGMLKFPLWFRFPIPACWSRRHSGSGRALLSSPPWSPL